MQTEYAVLMGDADVEPETDPSKPTPYVRSVFWRGLAESDEDAREKARAAWDEKYGPKNQPVHALFDVTRLAA